MPKGFAGLGNQGVTSLQSALTQLSTIPKYASAYPGPADGMMRPQLVLAVARTAAEIPGDKFPSTVKSALNAIAWILNMGGEAVILGLIAANATAKRAYDQAASTVQSHAAEIAAGVAFLYARAGAQGPGPMNPALISTVWSDRGTGTRVSPGAVGSTAIAFENRDGTFRLATPLSSPVGKQTHREVDKAIASLPSGAVLVKKYPYLKAIGEYRFWKDGRIWAGAGVAAAGAGTVYLVTK